MSIGFSDLSRGLVIELDGQPWEIMDYQRHKMQQRAPVTRLKMRNLLNGSVVERTFQQYSTGFTAADVDTDLHSTYIPTVIFISSWTRRLSINTI